MALRNIVLALCLAAGSASVLRTVEQAAVTKGQPHPEYHEEEYKEEHPED